MRRKITEKLLEWKRSGAEKKCLVVRGARQTGKTYSIDRFAKENYSRYYRLDLHEDVDARTIFDGNLDPTTLLMNMSAFIPGFDIVPGDTLIFIDEIQDCPNARASLKFLSENPDFDVIASGSLMGLRTKGTTFIPVGSEENLYMNPMDFEEFLWALGVSEKVMEHIRAHVMDMRPLEESVFQSMSQSSFFIMKNTATSLTIADLEDMTEGYSGTPNYRSSASSNANWPVYRLTDVMLIKAEALARSNTNLQEGFRLVNEIFARCNPALGSSNNTESDYEENADLQCDRLNDNYYSGKSASDLLTLLYNERQLEFFAEGKRWFDLVRQAEADNSTETALEWMAASTSLQNRLRSLYSMYNPIYYSELDANGVENGGYLHQNPVWEKYSN